MRRILILVLGFVLLATTMPASVASAATPPTHRPVIFVHGSAGSAIQFATHAKRFASNGYPASFVEAHDYDSTFATESTAQVFARLDERITRLLAETGADQIDLVGHSLGTFMSFGYLATPARAARVAHYVSLDGRTGTALPGGVPTLAIWGEGPVERTIVGATNVYLSDQAHTQTVTSPESFREIYTFLNGVAPRTTTILPEARVELSGRAVIFPINAGVTGARLEVYEVGLLTGLRLRQVASVELGGDGSFGPLRAHALARYEFAIVREGAATHHFYFEPFRRSDRLIRLQTSLPGQGLGALMDTSPAHANLVFSRNKEWWGDQGEGSDQLYVNGANILNPANAPRTKRVIGLFAFDAGADQATDLTAPIPAFFSQTFISAADVFVPTSLGLTFIFVRTRTGGVDLINIPAWPSVTDRSTIQVNDFD